MEQENRIASARNSAEAENMAPVKVSVILPSLNVEPYIRECVESVIGQTLREIEILCVDGGSTDGTLEILEQYEAEEPRLRIIQADRKSYGLQVNLGMDAARGEYVGIVETDDYVLPDMYEALYRTAKEQDADIVKEDFFQFTGEGNRRESVRHYSDGSGDIYGHVIDPAEDRACFFTRIATWNGIYRRSLLERHRIRHNESPGASYQDNGFFFLSMAHAKRIYFLPEAHYMLRRDNPASSVVNAGNMMRMLEEFRFIRGILELDTNLRQTFAQEHAFLCVQGCLWAFDRTPYAMKKDFLMGFRTEMEWMVEARFLRYSYFNVREREFCSHALIDPAGYLDIEVEPKRLLYEQIEARRGIVIYGAGVYGKRLAAELEGRRPLADVIGFAVSDSSANEEECAGLPVREIGDYVAEKESIAVLIAVKDRAARHSIRESLHALGFRHVLSVSWQLRMKRYEYMSVEE